MKQRFLKRALLRALSQGFSWDNTIAVGQLELAHAGEIMRCALIWLRDIAARLPDLCRATSAIVDHPGSPAP